MLVHSPFERWFQGHVDPLVERMIRVVGSIGIKDPIRWALAAHRRSAMQRARSLFRERVEALGPGVVRGDPQALATYEVLVGDALDHMRGLRPDDARALAALAAMERPLFRNEPEWLDDPSADAAERTRALDLLDRLNEHAGSYDAFIELVLPLIEDAERLGRSPVVVYDLAAGHAGFALRLKQRLGARIQMVATDLAPEYLALGRARAEALGLEVVFEEQDALALSSLGKDRVDVFTCTQSLHHFAPGMVARMIGEAARAARVGLCFVDGERSWVTLALIAAMAPVYGRLPMFTHDAMASVRRMFYEEELALLGALALDLPPDVRLETATRRPAHACLRTRRTAQAQGSVALEAAAC